MKSLVTSDFETSVQNLKHIINLNQISDDVVASLKAINDLKELLRNAKQVHFLNLEKMSKSKRDYIDAFVNSIHGHLRRVRVYGEKDFLVTLSGEDVFPDINEPFAHECSIREITVQPFCRFREEDFSKFLNPYEEYTKNVDILSFGFDLKIHFINKNNFSNYFVYVDMGPNNFKITEQDGSASWNIEKFAHMDEPIRYMKISSAGRTAEQFAEMLGFSELKELLNVLS